MARLGEFGAARAEAAENVERDTITLCGVEFTVADQPDHLAVMEFAEVAASGVDDESMEGMGAMLALIRSSVDEADWPKFRATVRRHRPDTAVLMELAMAVLQRETARPTQQPSDSSDGLSSTETSLKEPSSSVASSPLGNVPPIQLDPRIKELQPVADVGLSLVG